MTRDARDSRPRIDRAPGTGDEHELTESRLSDYYEGQLSDEEAAEVKVHLEACAACREAYRELEETVETLARLHRMAKPQRFKDDVQQMIHRRSAGRFFGRRALGDRVPFELLAILALILGLAVYGMLRTSETGSLTPPSRGGDVEAPAEL
jgi:anti-sigma factor RsiW